MTNKFKGNQNVSRKQSKYIFQILVCQEKNAKKQKITKNKYVNKKDPRDKIQSHKEGVPENQICREKCFSILNF